MSDGDTEHDYREVILSNGLVTLVSPKDYEWVIQFNWSYHKLGYAVRTVWLGNGRYTRPSLHRLLMDAKPGFDVDHIDGDKLNNRRSNLRVCTHQENQRNQKKPSSNTSGYKGVCQVKRTGKWQASIGLDGKQKYLGLFLTAEAAAKEYDRAALEHFGEFARLNFNCG